VIVDEVHAIGWPRLPVKSGEAFSQLHGAIVGHDDHGDLCRACCLGHRTTLRRRPVQRLLLAGCMVFPDAFP
jgi:hypothetical protein